MKDKEIRHEEKHGESGTAVYQARTSLWCYVWALLLMGLVLYFASGFVLYFQPLLEQATVRLKSLKPEVIPMLLAKLVLLLQAGAVYSAAVYCWQALFRKIEITAGGVKVSEGFFGRRQTVVARGKIRGITVRKNLLERLLGYGDAHIDFGSHEGPLKLNGISRPDFIAEQLS